MNNTKTFAVEGMRFELSHYTPRQSLIEYEKGLNMSYSFAMRTVKSTQRGTNLKALKGLKSGLKITLVLYTPKERGQA